MANDRMWLVCSVDNEKHLLATHLGDVWRPFYKSDDAAIGALMASRALKEFLHDHSFGCQSENRHNFEIRYEQD